MDLRQHTEADSRASGLTVVPRPLVGREEVLFGCPPQVANALKANGVPGKNHFPNQQPRLNIGRLLERCRNTKNAGSCCRLLRRGTQLSEPDPGLTTDEGLGYLSANRFDKDLWRSGGPTIKRKKEASSSQGSTSAADRLFLIVFPLRSCSFHLLCSSPAGSFFDLPTRHIHRFLHHQS